MADNLKKKVQMNEITNWILVAYPDKKLDVSYKELASLAAKELNFKFTASQVGSICRAFGIAPSRMKGPGLRDSINELEQRLSKLESRVNDIAYGPVKYGG